MTVRFSTHLTGLLIEGEQEMLAAKRNVGAAWQEIERAKLSLARTKPRIKAFQDGSPQ